MKIHALVLAALIGVGAGAALAQDNSDRNYPYDAREVARQQELESYAQRGWIPYPGYGYREYGARDYGYRDQYPDYNDYREQRRFRRPTECWNPRAGHFEEVRPGERQDDLDFSRCRRTRR